MLSELALSPAIFRTNSYESPGVADLCLRTLKTPLLDDCIVRNLHSGDWLQQLQEQRGTLHPKAKELIKKLKNQSRLVEHESVGIACPRTDEEWEMEAVASHERTPLEGMIFSKAAKEIRYSKNPRVACPEKLEGWKFWKDRPCSLRVPRNIDEYSNLLQPLFRHANCIAFMDPHLNPKCGRYGDFIQLLTDSVLARRVSKPTIEVHRIAWLHDSNDKRPEILEIEEIFCDAWTVKLKRCGIKVEVFLWDDFHDRFVASDLLSMSWSNGFDVTTDSKARVTVGRLSRADRDDLQLEFAINTNSHQMLRKFTIG